MVFGVLFYQCYILNAFEVQLNIPTGQASTAIVKKVMENVEQIGKTEVQKFVNDNSKNVQRVKFHTFEELHTRQQ